ncbi:hypothetical protein MKW92_020145 [Papaver armeniacum]|nr:hypothetical protein MKW92_020145 [Papaver armeniacum]
MEAGFEDLQSDIAMEEEKMGLENDFDADKDVVEEDTGMENDVGATADKDTVRQHHDKFRGKEGAIISFLLPGFCVSIKFKAPEIRDGTIKSPDVVAAVDMAVLKDAVAVGKQENRLEEHPVFVGLILLVFYGHDSDISVVTPECMLFCEYQMWTSPVPVVASITSSLV